MKKGKKKDRVFRSYEEFVRYYFPKSAEQILNPEPEKVIVILPRPGV